MIDGGSYCDYHVCQFNNCWSLNYNDTVYCYNHLCECCMKYGVYEFDAEKCIKCWFMYECFNDSSNLFSYLPMEILDIILNKL